MDRPAARPRSQQTQAGRDQKRRSPAEVGGDPGRERSGDCSADLCSRIHESGNRTGRAAGDVRSHRPERTLREIKSARPAREDDAGQPRALHLRAQNQKNAGADHDDRSQHAAAKPRTVRARKPVADGTADGATHSHREKRQHGVERAGFQIQSAHLGQVDIKPAEENPGDIAESRNS